MVQRILFVCTGNICRSPTGEGVLRQMAQARGLADQIEIASAGLGDWHVGDPPDRRTLAHALRRGYDLSMQRARLFKRGDFDRYDWVIAMDTGHHAQLSRMCPPGRRQTLRHAGDFSASVPSGGVPDPYYGEASDFELVVDLVESVCEGILLELKASRP